MNESVDVDRTCPNCGYEQLNKYCSNCGQKIRSEYTLGSIFRDIGEVIWGTDSRLWQTFKDYLKPGAYLVNWLAGKQARYISPVKMFLLLNLIYFLILSFGGFNTFVNNFHSHLNNQQYSESISQQALDGINVLGIEKETFISEFDNRVFNISNTLIIIMAIMYSIQFALLNLKKRLTLYEHIISGFYFSGVFLVIMTLLNVIFLLVSLISEEAATFFDRDKVLTIAILFNLYAVAFFIQKRSYKDSNVAALIKALILAVPFSFITIVIYRYILFWITYYSVTWSLI